MGQSMEWVFLGGVCALAVAAFAGRVLGRALRGRSSAWYWASNVVVLTAAMALVAYSAVASSDLLFGLGLGFGFGGLAGVRYGRKGLFDLPVKTTRDAAGAEPRDGGFTLLESLTAAAILLIVAGGIITTLIATSNWYANARLRTQAYAAANQVMENILARNYVDIHFANESTGERWRPEVIEQSAVWPSSGAAQFTILTSMETTTDPKTALEMKRIAVSAIPVNRSLEPTVTVIRFTSGWQGLATATSKAPVSLEVHLQPMVQTDAPLGGGARVQLLDPLTLSEAYFATSDSSGVARFTNVVEGQYYLSCDPRFGTDIRPVYFPMRIAPSHGGTVQNPIPVVNSYDLLVHRSSIGATLRVGAYQTEGWTAVQGPSGVKEPVAPEVPYRVVEQLVVYARPILNGSSASTDYYGLGGALLYPQESKLGPYSATVNAYGVAAIPIPYLTNSSQRWKIWCRTRDASGVVTVHTMTTSVSGDWDWRVQRPAGAFNIPADYSSIVQFSRLGAGAVAVNDPTEP